MNGSLMGKLSAESRGLPYYEGLNKQYPIHFSSFSRMHERCKLTGLLTDFPRNLQGFKDFIAYLGDIPSGMKKPSIGRKDHNLGYIKGNFAWQELSENSEEVGRRVGPRRILFTSVVKKRLGLMEFLKYITVDTLITDQLSKQLNYNHKKDLVSAVKCLKRHKTLGWGKHYITA